MIGADNYFCFQDGYSMKQHQTSENPKNCLTSVFKSGENEGLKDNLTAKWIELINQMEKNKETVVRQ